MEAKEEEKTDNGDAPANGTVSWRRGPASWPFVLAPLIMQVSLHPPPPPVQLLLRTALCLGCEMAQMLASKPLDVSTVVSCLVADPLGSSRSSTHMPFYKCP